MNTSRIITLSVTLAASACGHAAGTQPHDMSAAQHQAAAAQEEDQASGHAAQHDPAADRNEERCSAGKGRVCWTVTTNPTQGHVKTAEEHRELAAQHRAASQALQSAEVRACTGIDDADSTLKAYTPPLASVVVPSTATTSWSSNCPACGVENETSGAVVSTMTVAPVSVS